MVIRKRKDSPFYTVYKKGGNVEKKLPAKNAKSIAVDIEKIEFDIRKDITDQIIDDFKKNNSLIPTSNTLKLKFGNLCNLKCRMCGPGSSTEWAKEIDKNINTEYSKLNKMSQHLVR